MFNGYSYVECVEHEYICTCIILNVEELFVTFYSQPLRFLPATVFGRRNTRKLDDWHAYLYDISARKK